MIQKAIEVCIGTDRAGWIRVRLSLMIVEEQTILAEYFHSAMIMPGQDAAAIRFDLESHLALPNVTNGVPGAPWPVIPDKEWAKVTGCVTVLHTPEVVEKYRTTLVSLKT